MFKFVVLAALFAMTNANGLGYGHAVPAAVAVPAVVGHATSSHVVGHQVVGHNVHSSLSYAPK